MIKTRHVQFVTVDFKIEKKPEDFIHSNKKWCDGIFDVELFNERDFFSRVSLSSFLKM